MMGIVRGWLRERILAMCLLPLVSACITIQYQMYQRITRPEFDQVLDAVVLVECVVKSSSGVVTHQGSGWFIDPNGTIVTAAHVVDGRSDIRIYLRRANVPIPYRIVKLDRDMDVALLAPTANFHVREWFRISPSEEAKVGDTVWTVGHPWDFSWVVQEGIIIRKSFQENARMVTLRTPLFDIRLPVPFRRFMLLTSAWIAPGVSGGPMIDRRGKVIGMVVQYYSGRTGIPIPQHINWCVPATDIIRFLEAY